MTVRWVTYFDRDCLLFENTNELHLVSFFIFMCINNNMLQGLKVMLMVKEYQLNRHGFCIADILMVHVQKVLRIFSITILVLSSDQCLFPMIQCGLFLSELFEI